MDTKPALTGCRVCSNSSLVLFQKPTSQMTFEMLLMSPGCLFKEGEIPSAQQVQAFLNFVHNLNLQHSGVKILQPCKGPGSPWTGHLGHQGAASPKPGPRRCCSTLQNSTGPATFLSSHHRAASALLSSCPLKVT